MKKKHLSEYNLNHVPEDNRMRAYDNLVRARNVASRQLSGYLLHAANLVDGSTSDYMTGLLKEKQLVVDVFNAKIKAVGTIYPEFRV